MCEDTLPKSQSKVLIVAIPMGENGEIFSRVAEAFYMQHDYAQALVYYQRALDLFTARNSLAGTIARSAAPEPATSTSVITIALWSCTTAAWRSSKS